MPKLKTYTDDSSKSGYYILANVGGTNPITLQVSELGGQILQKAGYSSEENIPTKVVWSMFDVGILYTSGTINDPPQTVDTPSEIFRQLGVANELTIQEQDQLLSYLNEYNGPNQAEIDELRETLEESTAATQGGEPVPEDIRSDLDRLSGLYERGDLTTEEYELLKSRVLNDVSSTDTSPENSGATLHSDSRKEAVQFDIHEEFWNIVPEDKYDNSSAAIMFENKNIGDTFFMSVMYSVDEGGFMYQCFFYERAQEERMVELLEDNQWNLSIDRSDQNSMPYMGIERKTGRDGFKDDLPSGHVDDAITHFLELVKTVYQIEPSGLELSD